MLNIHYYCALEALKRINNEAINRINDIFQSIIGKRTF
jgi:hypothetical protein